LSGWIHQLKRGVVAVLLEADLVRVHVGNDREAAVLADPTIGVVDEGLAEVGRRVLALGHHIEAAAAQVKPTLLRLLRCHVGADEAADREGDNT
jgi:hypothetical protein